MPRISKPYFVIFDLDGVVAEELAAEGVATTANALLAGHRGKIIDESVRRFERDYSIALSDDWIDRVIPRALVETDRRLIPIPDAIMVRRPWPNTRTRRRGGRFPRRRLQRPWRLPYGDRFRAECWCGKSASNGRNRGNQENRRPAERAIDLAIVTRSPAIPTTLASPPPPERRCRPR